MRTMTADKSSLKVFVASPSDVGRERAEVLRAIDQINRVTQPTLDLHIEPLLWEKLPPVAPSLPKESIQDRINALVADCQVFVLILGSRYGSVEPGYQKSNTEREIEFVLHRVKTAHDVYLLSYFKDVGHAPDPGPQLQKVRKFQRALEREGIWYKTFKNVSDFRTTIVADLYGVVFRFLKRKLTPDQSVPGQPAEEVQREEPTPIVFASYSHDDDGHVRWVHTLATNLVENGIDVRLDLWDLHPGDDIADFMERGVAESNRVLVVCTPKYVARADNPTGGVGYEKTIITGEVVRNLGTNKFLPILRQTDGERPLPRCLSSRFYIDFTDDASYDESLEKLLRELHGSPEFRKPTLGQNPFG